MGNFWAVSIYVTFILKVCGYFFGIFREIRQLFISSSGHTADDDDDDCDVKEDYFSIEANVQLLSRASLFGRFPDSCYVVVVDVTN